MSLADVNANWERWIFASINTFLRDQADTLQYHAYIEGSPVREYKSRVQYIELRIDGPTYRALQSEWRVEVEVNAEVSTKVGSQLYDQNKISGEVAAMFKRHIPVYKFGNLAGDDPMESIGCLAMDSNVPLVAHKYGQIGVNNRLLQGTIEAKYWINLAS